MKLRDPKVQTCIPEIECNFSFFLDRSIVLANELAQCGGPSSSGGGQREEVRALLRRDFASRDTALVVGPLTLDTQRREISTEGLPLSLTRKEFGILEYLMLRAGQAVSQEELLEHIWEADSNPFSHAVRMHISSLRKKLRTALGYDPIVTKIGQGYRLEVRT